MMFANISEKHAKNVVFIPVEDIKSTDFSLTNEEKRHMIQLGREKTTAFLSTWTP